ncbi:Sushi, nidogen and EGF-like domain-containing protein 1 [Geodia barretti]|uniref:Sushi, nidogen and EGF-like domain-containing protein 1 n=1 Tax=Geodia barretti TaxID=519541 RepID=A0AA35SRM4_GEOBA|nr:Sushi, nidogen and EGF-like domain-containing protein 1 [Geodia barretti]
MLTLLLLLSSGVRAISLSDFYPFGTEANDSVLPQGDDGSSSPISLSQRFTLFGKLYSVIHVNINGNISPGVPFTSSHLDEVSFPTISPYRLDVDTRGVDGGHIWYRQTTESILLDQALSHVQIVYPSVFSLDYLFIATWDHVGYFEMHTEQNNTFQCVIAVDGDHTYAIYLYGLIQSSRGGQALAGYSAGSNGNSSYTIPGSLSRDILRITSTTNIECPGVWVFRLDEEELFVPEKETCDLVFDVENPPVCNKTDTYLQLPSYGCAQRYGSCVQFKANFETICDDFYEPDVDYIYVPHNRSDGSFSDLINQITVYGQLMLEPLQECKEIALHILCHYYLPPCGRQKQFTPPTAVCSEQCRLLPQLCPNEWAMVLEQFELNRIIIENVGLQLIDCDFPGKYLTPLPHCCTELSLNICKSISPIR